MSDRLFNASDFTFTRPTPAAFGARNNAPAGQLNLGPGFNYGPGGQVTAGMPSAMSMAESFGGFGGGLPAKYKPTWSESLLGYETNNGNYVPGYAGVAADLGLGAWQTSIAAEQNKAFMDSIDLEKQRFKANYESQKKNYNTSLEDRQRARVASNATAYQSVDTYMNKNGLA